jgi:hypothetical protein
MIAKYVIHYENGVTEEISVVCGEDVRSMRRENDLGPVGRVQISWPADVTHDGDKRVFIRTWENPHHCDHG